MAHFGKGKARHQKEEADEGHQAKTHENLEHTGRENLEFSPDLDHTGPEQQRKGDGDPAPVPVTTSD